MTSIADYFMQWCPPESIRLIRIECMKTQSQQSSAIINVWFQFLNAKPSSNTWIIIIFIGWFFHCNYVVQYNVFSCGHQSMCIRCIFKSIFGQLWHHASVNSADMSWTSTLVWLSLISEKHFIHFLFDWLIIFRQKYLSELNLLSVRMLHLIGSQNEW